jgi:hypothetical protein
MRKKTERTFELKTEELERAVFDYLVNVKNNVDLPDDAGKGHLILLQDGNERCLGARFVVTDEEEQ